MTSVLVYGLVNSATLILIALGFGLTFGLSRIPNFAHGGIYLLSGLVTWMLVRQLELPYALGIALAILGAAALGALIYEVVLRRVRGIELSEVIATFAVGVAIIETLRSLGFVTYEFNLRPFVRGQVEIVDVFVDIQRLLIVATALVLAVLLWLFSRYTKVGLALRGIAQDEETAISLGIGSDWAGRLSVAIGSALAAIAAVAILPLGIISIGLGYDALLVAVAVAVLGGLESTIGLVVGGLLLGYSQVVAANLLGTQWQTVVYLAAIVVVLAVRPSGIFGRSHELAERV